MEADRATWGELDRRAQQVAAALRRASSPGDRALLLYPPGLDFIAAFFGCLYAGVVAVPAYPPRPQRDLPRLRAIVADAAPAVALTASSVLAEIGGARGARAGLGALLAGAGRRASVDASGAGGATRTVGRAGLPPVHLRLDGDAQGGDGQPRATCCTTSG